MCGVSWRVTVGDGNDEDRETSLVMPPTPPSPRKPAGGGRNAALTALVGNLADSVSTAVTSIGLTVASGAGTGAGSTRKESSTPIASSEDKTSTTTAEGGAGSGAGGTGDDMAEDIIARSENYKMDVQDFIDAVEIDDVLIQVRILYMWVCGSVFVHLSVSSFMEQAHRNIPFEV